MARLKHGHCRQGLANKGRSREYTSYRAMVDRCTRSKAKAYPYYGGRGITICAAWLGEGGFERFFAYMGDRPLGMTLDRILNAGNYEPGNVRWADKRTQALNVGPVEFARRQEFCRAIQRRRQHRLALFSLARYGRVLGFEATEKLMREIRIELEERFGPVAPMAAPKEMLCIEESFIAGDFSKKSAYYDGLENIHDIFDEHGTWDQLTRSAA